jgi:trimethylamine--corrinoid protein Co-methyltransferase
VLERTGLLIRGEFLLRALADAGCKVDFAKQRAWFTPDVVERQIGAQKGRYGLVRSSLWYPFCNQMPKDDVAVADEYTVDYGFTTPSVYDYPAGTYRAPTARDQKEMILLGNAIPAVKAVSAPFICGDFDPRIESMETARMLLLNTDKPGWVSTSNAREVKFLAELAALALEVSDHAAGPADAAVLRTRPPMFAHAYCTTSPLKLDTHACSVLQHAMKHRFPVNFAPMPILGGTTPMTPAGSMVVATAEILGCITAVSLIDPDLYFYATAISGETDMKTTQVCYSTPAAILTDAALHQLFRFRYGMVLNVEPAYVEAKCPGIQAAFMKTFRQMAFASMVSAPHPIGLLDNGSAFSPTQAMIDLDANQAMFKLGQGIAIDDETLCVDLINRMEFCETESYLQTDHTLEHFRDVMWDTNVFDRSYRKGGGYVPARADARILEIADAQWRKLVASQDPPQRDRRFTAELDRVVEAARRELMGQA